MSRGIGRQAPALAVASIALLAALAGSVYAATRIDGHSIKVKSLPGNRLAPASVAANRLKPGTIAGNRLAPGSITGIQVDAATLGQVPNAAHADSADSARDAATALYAVSATDASRVNGHVAGCGASTRPFAGACWQINFSEAAVSAPAAASACVSLGGELPSPLALAAFAQQPGIALAGGGEWSNDVTNVSGLNAYAAVTVANNGDINFVVSTETRKYRCVLPLLS